MLGLKKHLRETSDCSDHHRQRELEQHGSARAPENDHCGGGLQYLGEMAALKQQSTHNPAQTKQHTAPTGLIHKRLPLGL
jgi:hypothetical protein